METIELLLALMPNATTKCPECGTEFKAARAVKRAVGEWVTMYCSEACDNKANAVLIKRQPKGMQIDGYDV